MKEVAVWVKKVLNTSIFEDMGGPALKKEVLAALHETENCRVTSEVPRSVKAVAKR